MQAKGVYLRGIHELYPPTSSIMDREREFQCKRLYTVFKGYPMANTIFDYLEWRGDLSLAKSEFNIVDNLILAVLSYVPFDGIVSEKINARGMSIEEAARKFALLDAAQLPIRDPKDIELLKALAASKRFGTMTLSGYVNKTDYKTEKQFSAITINTGDKMAFVSYRGTDLTLVGWKEDFNMTFQSPVPSQEEAVRYLAGVAKRISGKLRLGGHSKGGNLAVYAAAFCGNAIQKRIIEIYTNDGPGFPSDIIGMECFKDVQKRIYSFIPQSSIVGMLMEHNENDTIVNSTQTGILQHDPYSWSVIGTDFIRVDTITNASLFIDKTVKEWIGKMDKVQRELFCEALFTIIGSSGAKNFTELTSDRLKSARAMVKTFSNIDEPTKKILHETLALLFQIAAKNFQPFIPSRKERA